MLKNSCSLTYKLSLLNRVGSWPYPQSDLLFLLFQILRKILKAQVHKSFKFFCQIISMRIFHIFSKLLLPVIATMITYYNGVSTQHNDSHYNDAMLNDTQNNNKNRKYLA